MTSSPKDPSPSASSRPSSPPSPFTPPNNNLSEDELLVKSFYDLLQIKFDNGDFSDLRSSDDWRRAVDPVLRPGLVYGGIAAAVTFGVLRWLPKQVLNRAMRSPGTDKNWMVWDRTGNSNKQPFHTELYHAWRRETSVWMPRIKTNKDGSTEMKEGWLMAPVLILLDGLFGLAVGGMVWIVTTPKQRLFEAASEIPLQAGRSQVAETVCEDFIRQARRVPEEVWRRNAVKGSDDVTYYLQQFIVNCQRRRRVESMLRKEFMLPRDEFPPIPEPGVWKDLMIVDEEESDIDVVGKEKGDEGSSQPSGKDRLVGVNEDTATWGIRDGHWLDDAWEEDEEDDDVDQDQDDGQTGSEDL